jgi:tRNA-specific 2-thiouridylase
MSLSRKTVVVAMSGGVDSSVAAALLVKQGYKVIGMMMRLWSEPGFALQRSHNRCCTPDQMYDARQVAGYLNIPFYVLDVKDYFHERVVRFFIDEHQKGRTPNPCIECNREIRFGYLLEKALHFGADFLATGHYARKSELSGVFQLLTAIDKSKDQSYVLHVLNQYQLAHTLFPVGEYNKSEIRHLAKQFGIAFASKSESMDLCFPADGNYRRFLRENQESSEQSGPICSEDGKLLGQHKGLTNYTIGQRRGLGIAVGMPVFVTSKNVDSNTLFVGTRGQLGRRTFYIRDVNWISGVPPTGNYQTQVKIRYKAQPQAATLINQDQNVVKVHLAEPAYGVTAGQGAVFYDDELCLGGGIIMDDN